MATASTTDEAATTRRSVVPDAAGRSPWRAAIWTALGAVVVCATVAIVVVAVCWLPVSGTTGRTNSAIRAGLLTFLAAVHGGVTVDGVHAAWLPLGLLLIVALTAWRAGSGLADAAEALGERDPVRLALVGCAQAVTFMVGCLIVVPFATLGTSQAPLLGVAVGSLVLFAVTGGTAFVRSCALRDWVAERAPGWLAPVARGAAAATAVYLAAGALLVAASLVLHHGAVEKLSGQVGGGGWGGAPILLLGVLAAPNAAIAATSYLAGPGFALGSGTAVQLTGSAHGTLPAFPELAAVPTGPANPVTWGLAALTALGAGIVVARLALRGPGWRRRFGYAGGSALVAGVLMFGLGWQGGGALGDGRLHTIGASPWQLGGAVTVILVVIASVVLGLAAAGQALRGRAGRRADRNDDDEPLLPQRTARLLVVAPDAGADDDTDEAGELAG